MLKYQILDEHFNVYGFIITGPDLNSLENEF